MKKVLRLIVFAAALTFVCCIEKDITIGDDQEQTSSWDNIQWPISGDAFPDPVFRAYVFDNFDIDKDGKISKEEALNVISIEVMDKEIKSLVGLAYFPELIDLMCSHNLLTSLDVSKNPELRNLFCDSNQLIGLDVSKNPELRNLYCFFNLLTSLDVSKNPKLWYVMCGYNQLTSLDVSKNPELWLLECSFNQLTSLDVTKNPKLSTLYCYDNQLTSLDVSMSPNLSKLECFYNQLTSLDVSKNPKLGSLVCSFNQLTSLDVSKTNLGNSTHSRPLYCSMPSLQTLTLKKGWSIEGINVNSNTDCIPSHTEILYVD